MHNVVARLARSVPTAALLAGALLAGALVAAGPATADTAPLRPARPDTVNPGSYTALATPKRLLDTRIAKRPLQPNEARAMPAVTTVGVPENAAAVVVNLTAASPRAVGYLSAFPGTTRPSPLVSNLNFAGGAVVANAAVVKIADATFTLLNGSTGTSDVVVDVIGWFAAGGSTDGSFTAVAPTRLIDTRTPPNAAIPAGGTLTVAVRGKADIPSTAGAAVLNVTVAKAGAQGYLTLYPGGTAPAASNVNFAKGQTVAGLAAVSLAASSGTVTIRNASGAAVQVTVDVAGWFRGTTARQAGNFSFLTPARLFDTRSPKATLAPGQTRAFPVTGRGGVPTTGVAAVVLTVTVTNPQTVGYLTVYPGDPGQTRPLASTLNFARGQTVPNLVVVPVSSNGTTVSIYNGSGGTADVLADVAGFVRSSDLDVPAASVSHYIRTSVRPNQTDAQITAATSAIGQADAQAASTTDRQVVLLQFGAQSAVAGPAGNQKGVRLTTPTTVRLTYAQVVTAVEGYLDGYVEGRNGATNPVTVLVGTNTDGFAGADTLYPPATKGKDWADLVVEPLVAHAAGTGITVAGASDIEPDFDADVPRITTWINAYLAAGPNPFVNNGAASGCPTTLGQVSQTCQPVPIKNSTTGQTNTWSQASHYAFAGGINPARMSVLPQIYLPVQATQWENISLTGTAAGRPALPFAGVLTSTTACDCTSLDPDDAWTIMTQALESNTATDDRTVPAVSDIRID